MQYTAVEKRENFSDIVEITEIYSHIFCKKFRESNVITKEITK